MGMSEAEVFCKLKEFRQSYGAKRLEELGLSSIIGPYDELLSQDYVLLEEARIMCQNRALVQLISDMPAFLEAYDRLIFEGAQGLLLDDLYEKYAPHLTPSRTGCHNSVAFLQEYALMEEAVRLVYITRSYITRHGAGPLPYEITDYDCRGNWTDLTNVPNPWQGTLRYARHGNFVEFLEPVVEDLEREGVLGKLPVTLFITHLNETGGCMWMQGDPVSMDTLFAETAHVFSEYILSKSAINE